MHEKLKYALQIRGVKLTLELAIVLLIFIAIKAYMQRDLVDGPVPSVQGTLISGQAFNLQNFNGETVLLHFWATWCGVCKLEQDSINAISKDRNVITIAMNSGNEQEVKAFLEKNSLSFPVLIDEHGVIAEQFGVRGVPTSFIIDPRGHIAFTEVGYTTSWGLRLRLWLAGK